MTHNQNGNSPVSETRPTSVCFRLRWWAWLTWALFAIEYAVVTWGEMSPAAASTPYKFAFWFSGVILCGGVAAALAWIAFRLSRRSRLVASAVFTGLMLLVIFGQAQHLCIEWTHPA